MRTTRTKFATFIATLGVVTWAAPGAAQEDPTAVGGGKKPFVLVVIDSSASMEWTTEGDDVFPTLDWPVSGNPDGDGIKDVVDTSDPTAFKQEYKINADVEIGLDVAAPNDGVKAFGPCVVWEPVSSLLDTEAAIAAACLGYNRPPWRPGVPDGYPLADPFADWQVNLPNDGSGSLMGPRFWNYMRGNIDFSGAFSSAGRLQDQRQPRHVTIKEVMTGEMILLPNNLDPSTASFDFTTYNQDTYGPGCFLVPRMRDATAVPSEDSQYCLWVDGSGSRTELPPFANFPDYNQPYPHFQEVYDGQLRNGVMDRMSTTVIFSFAAFDGFRDDSWDPNKLNDKMDGTAPTSLGATDPRKDPTGTTSYDEGADNCKVTPGSGLNNEDCYNLGLYRVVTPKRLDIPATLYPQISAFTQIALNDTGYLVNSSSDSDFTLDPREKESRARAFLGSSFSKGFDKYIDKFQLGRQPIARATPLAAVMHDAYQFFAEGQDGKHPIGDDDFIDCRPKHVVLLTDGKPEPELGEATLGPAFGYEPDRYIYGTTEEEIKGMVMDVDNKLFPQGDSVAENDFGLRAHVVGLNIGAGDDAAIAKLARMAIEGNSCAEALLGKEYHPASFNTGGTCGANADDICLVDQSAAVSAYITSGSYVWSKPGTTDTYPCNHAPAFILTTNDPDSISTVLFRMFSELLQASGLASRTRTVVANRLDKVLQDGAGNDFVASGQYRFFSGVRVGGADWWKGVINRLEIPCDNSATEQISLDEQVGTQVSLANDEVQDSRRIWTSVPHTGIYDHVNEVPETITVTSPTNNSMFIMNFGLAKSTEDEFQGTYLTNNLTNAAILLGTRIPFRRAQLEEAYEGANGGDASADYLENLNALSDDEVDDVINAFRSRVDARVPQSQGGSGGDARAIGGILNSNPVVVGPPDLDLPIGSYREFRARYADRPTMLYVSSMDGHLHALYTGEPEVPQRDMTSEGTLPATVDFNKAAVPAEDQREAWAYLPFMLHRELASNINSQPYLSDGTPVVKDVRLCNQDPDHNTNKQACRVICDSANCNTYPSSHQWRTVLVQSRGLAGTGYYALDVTRPGGRDLSDDGTASLENPDPIALWEFDAMWERAQVQFLYDNNQKARVASTQDPDDALWDTAECGNSVDTFWKSSFLGLSSSEPEIASLLVEHPNGGNSQRPVAVFGGGVPLPDSTVCGAGATGMAIYVVDLQTGTLLRRFVTYRDPNSGTEYHFGTPGAPTVMDDPGAGYFAGAPALFDSSSGAIATRGFIGDSTGRLFRMDFLSPDPTDWKVELFYDPYSDTALRTAYNTAGFSDSEPFGPASYKPAITLNPQRQVMVVYGTGEPGDVVANNQGQAIIALTENLNTRKGNVAWAQILDDGEKLTGEPVIFDRVVYFPSYQVPRDDVCAPGTARIWGLKLVDTNLSNIAPEGALLGDPALAGPPTGIVVDGAGRFFGPEDPTLIRGVTVTLGPQCAVSFGGTDNSDLAAAAIQKPQLIAQTSGNVDTALKNTDESSGATNPLNEIDRLVLDRPVPKTQSIPLSWSIITN